MVATRRDPSAFEYTPSSSAPAVLGRPRRQQPQSTVVSALIAREDDGDDDDFVDIDENLESRVSTTQLGLQRLEGVIDAY